MQRLIQNTLRYLFVLIIGASIPLSSAFGDELKAAFGMGRPPFIFDNGDKWEGLELLLATEALAYKGHRLVEKEHVSNFNLQRAVSNLGFDMTVGVQKDDKNKFVSDPFISYENYAISRVQDNVSVNKISDLLNYRTIAWQNAHHNIGGEFETYFHPESEKVKAGEYIEFKDQRNQNVYFWVGRAQVIIIDKSIFRWNKKLLADQYDTSVQVKYHNLFPDRFTYYVSFRSPKIKDEFNEGLAYLRKTGRYQVIVDRYLDIPKPQEIK